LITLTLTGLSELQGKLSTIDLDGLCFAVAQGLKDDVHRRVHKQGQASDGSHIGTYTPGYMKVRTGNYPETRIKSGINKGQFRKEKSQKKAQAGVFSKGKNKGRPRPVYNRSTDPKVILALTSAMEQDFLSTPPQKIANGYGIGYSEEFDYNKAIWNEKRYKKPIWALSEDEQQHAQEIVHNYLVNIGVI